MNEAQRIFGRTKPIIGMCHARALRGRPGHDVRGGPDAIFDAVAPDLEALQRGGVDGILFCNEGDLPYQLRVGPEIVAAMAALVGRLRSELSLPFGVDLVWDPIASLSVARATSASFVRGVFTGVYDTDMGLMSPVLGDLYGFRAAIGANDVAVFTNITPEFGQPVSGRPVEERAKGAVYNGIDGLIVSGLHTGLEPDLDVLKRVKAAVPEAMVIASSGLTADNVEVFLAVADAGIVGTSLKVDGNTWNSIDPERVRRFVEAVDRCRAQVPA